MPNLVFSWAALASKAACVNAAINSGEPSWVYFARLPSLKPCRDDSVSGSAQARMAASSLAVVLVAVGVTGEDTLLGVVELELQAVVLIMVTRIIDIRKICALFFMCFLPTL